MKAFPSPKAYGFKLTFGEAYLMVHYVPSRKRLVLTTMSWSGNGVTRCMEWG